MKEDILKKFVDENRDQFDDQLPDADVLGKIQSRLNAPLPVAAPEPSKIIRFRYWWAAAAVFAILIGISILFQQNQTDADSLAIKGITKAVKPTPRVTQSDSMATITAVNMDIAATKSHKLLVKTAIRSGKKQRNADGITGVEPAAKTPDPVNDWQSALQSESSSVRLAAVLASGKNSSLSDSDLNILFHTMNNDENSNVRLAVLDVLKKQEKREIITTLFLESVDKQNDPVVQVELLASLSPAEVEKVEKQLLGITQNPLTIDAVRNEAYAVLLRSNANF